MGDPSVTSLLIIDDQINSIFHNKKVAELFCNQSRHANISVWLLLQNLYYKAPLNRTITLQLNVIFFFKNPRDRMTIKTLNHQCFGKDDKRLIHAYETETVKPYTYVTLLLDPYTSDFLRVRGAVTPDVINTIYF